jgi:hypothetical protein
MRIRLFTTRFPETDQERRREYDEALSRNAACPAIDEICILEEVASLPIVESTNIRVRAVSRRPEYGDYFDWVNELAGPDDVSIVANADIAVDPHFGVFRVWRMPADTAFALARWEIGGPGKFSLRDRNDSQDSWVFQGPIKRVAGNFRIGVPRCDNRIAAELEIAGYTVRNPSFSLRTYHIHSRRNEPYSTALEPGFVPPPYRYVWPHNLWGLGKTLAHNTVHSDTRLPWRFDRRKAKSRLRLHWVQRALSVSANRSQAGDG